MAPTSDTPSASPADNADGTSNKKRPKKRIRAFTAEERASHRVIEKQRREALNERFLDLARLLPDLVSCRRLSKSIIVHESIEHLQAQREMCLAAASEVQTLISENLELIAEVNRWREQFSGCSPWQPKPLGEGVTALLKVDQEVFGTFPGGFGDNSHGDGGDEDHTAGNQERSQTEDGGHPISHTLPMPEVPKIPNVPPDISPVNFQNETSLPIAAANASTSMNFDPNNTRTSSGQQIDLLDPTSDGFFTIMSNTYGNNLDPDFGIASGANNFDSSNMDHNLFLDIPMAIPNLNYNPNDTFHFRY
ncbi:hypothetical protein BKA64DRAFT_462742 [Cadophora sp. MPI-SDFR-AT-0126]|nr:hypothetical protein BKA64DRAFT_462742 [Leotiomycetes sp. MPI-SDFR-AT-0126]